MRVLRLIAAAALTLGAMAAQAASLKVGVVPGAYADAVNAVVGEAKAKGIDVTVVEFSDWNTPNVALDAGDIDVNFFQHRPFMENVEKQKGYDFEIVGLGILQNLGLYSLKHKSLDAVPVGGRVAIANDPVNQGRGLLLLQKAGLIRLKDGVGFLGTLDDIVENPKTLKFTEVEGPQLVRVTGDVDLAQGYPHFIVAAGSFDPTSGLVYSGIEDKLFAVSFVTKAARKDDATIRKFVDLFHNSEAVKAQIRKSFADSDKLYVLAWLK
ncbi:MAG: MetQ/NlpA family ABC transporter substrate-binding protein [Methylobacterium sp.]|jgi:D-methionine transport system substrate-binding protein|uniref:MetQ/NlpA family ABC transporter substrate-binding protein n=1 Tax=unclassified Methylobacterium TaxID=2615210 RepID=UPI0006F6C676|nr:MULTISPECIES: MetQ/NlpA family ABC transporter substrate-binding protein [unclassified Methylobacterium]KQP10415.1 metal ABC transporter substrate-binding protein [Methylobacterium sp. Leaf99]MDO9425523.1 MetQ/NlpA family ABC transporter substrate-binding protein [Methylobacterium sp.]TXM72606.1 MetQ/NlpA family ABC transporter substrate-binding protein [Methylobacterium sp. WL69]